jgi:hypothetical protein
LGKDGEIGIGVAAGVAVLILAAIAMLLFRKRRSVGRVKMPLRVNRPKEGPEFELGRY